MKKVIAILITISLAGLTWLVLADPLGRGVTGLALGVVFGVLLVAPAVLLVHRTERVIYQERIVYRVAEPVGDDEVQP